MAGHAVIVAIGDELLSGETVDTNSSFIDAQLERWGWRVVRHLTVSDDAPAITEAFRESAKRADLVISTGGLGPTQDDLTLAGLAEALGTELVLHPEILAAIEARFARRGWTVSPNHRRQAMVPADTEVLPSEVGTAPCVAAVLEGANVFVLPGVPSEVRWLLEHRVKPRIAGPAPVVQRRLIKVIGIGESRLETLLGDVITEHDAVRFGFRALGAENHVKLAAFGPDAADRLERAEAAARSVLGGAVFGGGEDDLAAAVGRALRAAGQTVSTAESCTGGLVATWLTDVAGSSAYFVGGVVAYANTVKVDALGVDPQVLAVHGAVSEPVARQMAAGVRERLGTDWALSATGIAGPGGGTPEKPVGLVWTGLAGPDGVETRALHRHGTRANIRQGSAKIMLHWLLNSVRGSTS